MNYSSHLNEIPSLGLDLTRTFVGSFSFPLGLSPLSQAKTFQYLADEDFQNFADN